MYPHALVNLNCNKKKILMMTLKAWQQKMDQTYLKNKSNNNKNEQMTYNGATYKDYKDNLKQICVVLTKKSNS